MKKILFIGNSHTYFNDMPTRYFQKIAQSAGYQVNVTSLTSGGKSLADHLSPICSTYQDIQTALVSGQYDIVVLQERLATPIIGYTQFSDSVDQMAALIRASNPKTKIILWQVWGGSAGNIRLTETNCSSPEELTWRLAAANQAVGTQVAENGMDIRVAYVGVAFLTAVKTINGICLYNEHDGYHPSECGSYLAALTLFSATFDVDPDTVTWLGGENGGLYADIADALKKVVKQTVFTVPRIKAEYAPKTDM